MIITLTITILVLFLKFINVLQVENGLGNPFIIILMIICFSFITIFIQKNIDKNYKKNKVNYQNLDILKYISAILIIILHLRPFLNFSNELDLAFNNIITRICVPIFFIITGYFVAKKEKDNSNIISTINNKTLLNFLDCELFLSIISKAIFSNFLGSSFLNRSPFNNSLIETSNILLMINKVDESGIDCPFSQRLTACRVTGIRLARLD